MKYKKKCNMKSWTLVVCLLGVVCQAQMSVQASEIPWTVNEIIPGGRIDAIASLGDNVVVVGTRNPNPGWIFYSTDNGLTWKKGQQLESSEKRTGITCIAGGTKGLCFAINESSEFFKSFDYGKTWKRISKLSSGVNLVGFAISYGLCVTNRGTVLVSDTNTDGGFIYRSTDGGDTFTTIGPVSPKGLYRFQKLHDGIMVNGWEGSIYKTEDDGLIWHHWCKMDSTALYATEFVEPGMVVQASEAGYIYEASQDIIHGFTQLARPGGSANDFVYLGYNTLVYTTYTESKSVFVSYDKGKTWIDDGPVPTNVAGDWLDHAITIELPDSVVLIGGTNKGFIVKASFPRSFLSQKTAPVQAP